MHTPLLELNMSGKLHYFLAKYLDFFRLQVPVLDEEIENMNRESGPASTHNSDEPLLALCGYNSDFVRNLVIVISLLSVLGLAMLILTVFPYLINRHKRTKRYAAWVTNASIRFFY